MPLKLRQYLRFLLILACLGIVQCGGETESSKVDVRVEPKSPIIITADGKDGAGNDIKAPWYQFRLVVKNNSSKDLTIIGVKLTSVLNEPGVEDQEAGFTASYFSFTNADGEECNWYEFWYKDATNTYYPYFPKNQPAESELYLPDPFDPTAPATCGNYKAIFVPGGLNRPADKNNRNYRYRITLEVLGWFGRPDSQEDRFTRKVTFITR